MTRPGQTFQRRRVGVAALVLAIVVALGVGAYAVQGLSLWGGQEAVAADPTGESSPEPTTGAGDVTPTETTPTETLSPEEQLQQLYAGMTPEVPAPPIEDAAAPEGGLIEIQQIRADMTPKSVVASGTGIVFAQNMMYSHTVTVLRADGAVLETIPDTVTLSEFGIEGHPGESRGAPVEMAFSPDKKHAWVSNYSMYGAGFGPEGSDSCVAGDGTDTSFLYRIDTTTFEIDKVVPVGAVPKFVAVTPDGSKVLVTNWCTWDLSIVSTDTFEEVARVDLGGTYPRGIVVSPDSSTAYVALMGSDRIVTVDLETRDVADFAAPGNSPRHLVLSPDGQFIYVTNNRSGNVVKLDRETGEILGSVPTGTNPRSMDISSDGKVLFVVNYNSHTVSSVRASDMTVLSTRPTAPHPIGVTYEPTKDRVWVASYGGTVHVFERGTVP